LGIEAQAPELSYVHVKRTLGRGAVITDFRDLEHVAEALGCLFPDFSTNLHVVFHRSGIGLDLDTGRLGSLVVEETMKGDQPRFLGLDDF
jgi:hypothetical protein